MRRVSTLLGALLVLALMSAPVASADFGLRELDVTFSAEDGSVLSQAGEHPFAFTTTLGVTGVLVPGGVKDPESGEIIDGELPEGEVRNLRVIQMPGLVGSQTAVPKCSTADFNVRVEGRPSCPDATAVGIVAVKANFSTLPLDYNRYLHVAVYNLVPGPGQAARLGFVALNVPVVIDVGVNTEAPYNLIATVADVPQAILFYGSKFTIWGNPASPAHDSLRGDCVGQPVELTKEPVSLGECAVNIAEKPFLTLPRACRGPLTTIFTADSWSNPGAFTAPQAALTHDGASAPNPLGMTGCAALGFDPTVSVQPTNLRAESPTGLEVGLQVEDEGLTSPGGRAEADIEETVIVLPQGMTANPSAAEGLLTCSKARYESAGLTVRGCPEGSKLGSLEVETPLLEKKLEGSLYLADPDDPSTGEAGAENPFDSLLALYMTIRGPVDGIFVKLPIEVRPDPLTGQLVSIVREIPQLPFASFKLRFREGPRAPLTTPPLCGAYAAEATLTPSSGGEPLKLAPGFEVSSGPNGGPCPSGGAAPFSPGFEAGTTGNQAGSYSPFFMRLTRRDGDQDLTKFSAALPPGLVAKLAGTSNCSDAAIAAARTRSGKEERGVPSCPDSSRIGRVLAGAGVGPELTYVPGSVYLAGPYNGAPLSVVAIVPAVAGPFDVGTVVTRQALKIDRRTAEVTVDGEASDPIPHILAGIPLKVRDIRIYVDRPDFTLNPTSCQPAAVGATLWGGGTDLFGSGDDVPTTREQRFQAAGCAALGFKPSLRLKLTGSTKRGGHPAFTGTYTPRPGDANLEGLSLRLPRSAFLEQGHIRTICTRVQFARKACPPGSVYGKAKAWTPLLDQPLEGPVYLRSSSNPLPDFVADLRGLIDVEAVARIDSKNGGIRATFTEVPDAPLSRVVVSMRGGRKGLIVNSTNLCAKKHRADVRYTGQNGAKARGRPVLVPKNCRIKKKRRGR